MKLTQRDGVVALIAGSVVTAAIFGIQWLRNRQNTTATPVRSDREAA